MEKLDANDILMAEMVSRTGISMNSAKIVISLLHNNGMSQSEIGVSADLMQSVVSVAIKPLVSKEWVIKSDNPEKKERGRVAGLYTLIGLDEIIDKLEKQIYIDKERSDVYIAKLKSMA